MTRFVILHCRQLHHLCQQHWELAEGGRETCKQWKGPGSDSRARVQGAPGLSKDMTVVLQISGMVATSSSGSFWTASSSRLSSRMRGAWTLTWLPWRTSMSRTLSTCEQWPALTCLPPPFASFSYLASHQGNLSSLSQARHL